MEDDIIKHTQKIFKTFKDRTQSLKVKSIAIIKEIFIIVFAVTLSIKFHGWSEDSKQQQEVSEFLIDLKSDLQKDITAMNNEMIEYKIGIFSINNLTKLSNDEIQTVQPDFHLTTRRTNEGNFEGFKSSGKIGFIQNKELKTNILEYFVQNMPPLYKMEENRNVTSIEIFEEISDDSNLGKTILKTKVKTMMSLYLQYSNLLIESYDANTQLAKKIIEQIDAQIKA